MTGDQAQTLSERLSRCGTADEVDSAYEECLGSFDELNRETVVDRSARLECCEGCSLCCWLRVDVYAHEVFVIANYIRKHFTEQALAELKESLAEHSGKVLPLTPFEHATQNIACPLLQDGRCTVYEVRPQACRRQHSLSRAACQYTFDHPADLAFPG